VQQSFGKVLITSLPQRDIEGACLTSPFAAFAAKNVFQRLSHQSFLETPILLILRSKINKIGVSRNFILLPKAA